jgi:hypothetical protein
MKSIILAAIAALSVTACATTPITVTSKPVEKTPLVLPSVDRYYHQNVNWIVITKENAAEVFAMLQKKGQSLAIIGVTGDSYKTLAINGAGIQTLIKQLKAIAEAYDAYYKANPQ